MADSLTTFHLQRRKPLRILTDLPLFLGRSSDSSSSSSSPTYQNSTPGTTPSTGVPQRFLQVTCIHDFESSDPDHLPFHKDEMLIIVKQELSGWWAAIRPRGDRIGWIPSSFVRPLDARKVVEHPDETLPLWSYEKSSDHPLSAVHDPWVPVSEDCTVLSFRLVTPTDPVLCKGFFDDKSRGYNRELFASLPNKERSPNGDDVCIPPAPPNRCPPPHKMRRSHPPASPRLLDAAFHHHPHYNVRGQIPLPRLKTLGNPDDTRLNSTLDTEDSLARTSAGASQGGIVPDDEIDDQSQYMAPPTDVLGQGIPDIELVDLTIWDPDNVAKQLSVLMHTLYATICQDHCIDWVRGRRSTEATGLRQFLDSHDDIASWVHKSTLAHNNTARQTETLNFWIRVAERCHLHRNFDSLCMIILALSSSSSLIGSAWTQCAHKRTFATLHNMLDVTNKYSSFVGIMDAAKGPSVPFVRGYLEQIKEWHLRHFNNPLHQSRHAEGASLSVPCNIQLAGISTLLRHQFSPYNFEITKSIRGVIDHELRTVRSAGGQLSARNRNNR